MKQSHERIEGLLNNRPETGSVGEGFAGRVAEGIQGVAPGADPVASAVMTASAKTGLMLGAVGVVSAAIWFATASGPAAQSLPQANNTTPNQIAEDSSVEPNSIIAPFKDLIGPFASGGAEPSDLIKEGSRLMADARKVGEVFLSVFPQEWISMLFPTGAGNPSGGTGTPAAPADEPGTGAGPDSASLNG